MDLTPQQLLQQAADRAVDEMARQEAALVETMGPAQREGARQTLLIFERVRGRHGAQVGLSVVIRLAVLQVCRDPVLLEKFRVMAQAGEVGVIKGGGA